MSWDGEIGSRAWVRPEDAAQWRGLPSMYKILPGFKPVDWKKRKKKVSGGGSGRAVAVCGGPGKGPMACGTVLKDGQRVPIETVTSSFPTWARGLNPESGPSTLTTKLR